MSFGHACIESTVIYNVQQIIWDYLGKTFWFYDNSGRIKTLRWVFMRLNAEHITNRENALREVRWCQETLRARYQNAVSRLH